MIAIAPLVAAVEAKKLTPQSAAQRSVYASNGSQVVVVRTNIVGPPLCDRSVHGGYVEGAPADDAPSFFKHFRLVGKGLNR